MRLPIDSARCAEAIQTFLSAATLIHSATVMICDTQGWLNLRFSVREDNQAPEAMCAHTLARRCDISPVFYCPFACLRVIASINFARARERRFFYPVSHLTSKMFRHLEVYISSILLNFILYLSLPSPFIFILYIYIPLHLFFIISYDRCAKHV